ncbi:hypothetical protein HDV04_003113 [Boothiomyces sp. JEL0838]|nr:hypothetical protein HDV04_003113 [Boothiomyces sp. JEL0838]
MDRTQPSADAPVCKLKIKVYIKEFLRQHTGRTGLDDSIIELTFSSDQEFQEKLWDLYANMLKRKAIFLDDGSIGCSDEEPTIDMIDNYFLIKRSKNYEGVKKLDFRALRMEENKQQNERKEYIELTILKYSNNLQVSSQFQQFSQKFLRIQERDRGGAVANAYVEELTEKLMEIHRGTYVSAGGNYRLWANWLVSHLPANEIDENARNPPPSHLIHLFRSTRERIVVQVQEYRRKARMSFDALDEIKGKIDHLKEFREKLVECEERVQLYKREFDNRIESLEETVRIYRSMFEAIIQDPTLNVDTTLGAEFEGRVVEQDDIDH